MCLKRLYECSGNSSFFPPSKNMTASLTSLFNLPLGMSVSTHYCFSYVSLCWTDNLSRVYSNAPFPLGSTKDKTEIHTCYPHTKKAKWLSQRSEDDTEMRSAVSTECFHDNSLAGPPPSWPVCNESSALKVC